MSAKKSAAKKSAKKSAKKAVAKKAAKRPIAAKKKSVAKKSVAKRAVAKKSVAKKSVAKRAVAKKAPAKKAVAKTAPAKKAAAKKPAVQKRRDATGHLNPRYAAELRAQAGERDTGESEGGFLSGARSNDPLAEELGEEFVRTATSGEDEGQEVLDEEVTEESGGPFVETEGRTEFARGTDASNPRGAKREPFPKT